MSTLTEIANKLIEQTNCSTAEAIEALDKAEGDYEKALNILHENKEKSNIMITLEEEEYSDEKEEQGKRKTEQFKANGKDILKIIKGLLKEGNVTRITIKQKGEIILNFPVNAAAIGVILAPYLSVIGAIAAIATDCIIEVEREGDVVVNVNSTLKKAGDKVEKTVKDILEK